MFAKIFSFVAFVILSVAVQAKPVIIPAPPQLASTAYILMDADTGKVLVEHNADKKVPPASLTKLMTSYIVTNELASGRLQGDDMVNISVKAWKTGGSKMFVREGTQVSVMDLLRGVIVQSGNDASVALAEHIAGGEKAFADIMNQTAKMLGMTNTHYVNATGLPVEGHLTTARDLAKLSRAIVNDPPKYYELYSEKYFTYNNIKQPNRNRLLFRDPSVDGLKTGHTNAAGYCLVSSAKRDGMRLISVVLGTKTDEARAAESQKLLAYGFRYYEHQRLYAPGDVLANKPVWYGKADTVTLTVAKKVALTIPRGSRDSIKATLQLPDTLKAPITQGQKLGTLTLALQGKTLVDVPVVAQHAVAEAGFFARLFDSIKLFFSGLFS